MNKYGLFLSSSLILMSFLPSATTMAASCGYQASGDYNCGATAPAKGSPGAAPTTSTTDTTPSPFIPGGGPLNPHDGTETEYEDLGPETAVERAWRTSPQAEAANAKVEEIINTVGDRYDVYSHLENKTPEQIMNWKGPLVTSTVLGVLFMGEVLKDDEGNTAVAGSVGAPYKFQNIYTEPEHKDDPDDPDDAYSPEHLVTEGSMPDLWTINNTNTTDGFVGPSTERPNGDTYGLKLKSVSGEKEALAIASDFTADSLQVCSAMFIPSATDTNGMQLMNIKRTSGGTGRPSTNVRLGSNGQLFLDHYTIGTKFGFNYTATSDPSNFYVVPKDRWFTLCTNISNNGSATVTINNVRVAELYNADATDYTYTDVEFGIVKAGAGGGTVYADDLMVKVTGAR